MDALQNSSRTPIITMAKIREFEMNLLHIVVDTVAEICCVCRAHDGNDAVLIGIPIEIAF